MESEQAERPDGNATQHGLAGRVLLGLVAGTVIGAAMHGRAEGLLHWLVQPLGTIWLRLLLVLVMPLALSALVLGVLELQPKALLRAGGRMLALAIGLTGIAVALGVGLVTALQPGRGMDLSALPAADKVQPAGGDPVALIVDMVPGNVFAAASKGDLVAVLVFGVLFALALRPLEGPGPDTLRAGIDGLYRVCVRAVHGVLRAAPLGVAALMAAMVARTGLEGLVPLLRFVGVVLLGLGIQFIVVYGLTLRVLARRSPLDFARAVRPALAMAFSTASSAATLPTTLEVAERGLGLPPEQSRFVLTVGATANQNGTALFEGVAAIFLAQLYGVDLSTAQMATVCGIAILGGIGTAGVPGGALPVIAALLASLGVPVEAVGVIVGVDRLLDMCRTTLNVAGDLVIAEIVARRA